RETVRGIATPPGWFPQYAPTTYPESVSGIVWVVFVNAEQVARRVEEQGIDVDERRIGFDHHPAARPVDPVGRIECVVHPEVDARSRGSRHWRPGIEGTLNLVPGVPKH